MLWVETYRILAHSNDRGVAMPKKILVVDDERKIVALVRDYLQKAGFDVLVAEDGQQAVHVFRNEKPSLVVLDLGLPELDGLEVTRIIRRESNTPIIMLTARVDETDKLIGLELGADDYVTKPFSPRELVARVRVVLRRTEGAEPEHEQIISAGDVTIDTSRRLVTIGDEQITLTPTEFDLLSHPGARSRASFQPPATPGQCARDTPTKGTSEPSTRTSRTCARRSSPIHASHATS